MRFSNNLRRAACAAVACAVCFSWAAAAGIGTGKVTASVINMRSGASTSCSIVTTAKCGAEVEIISEHDGWYEVSYNGTTGFMSKDYVKLIEKSVVSEKYGVVTGSSVRFRKGPSTASGIIREVGVGTKFVILSQANGWTHVKSDAYGEGYICSDYIREYVPGTESGEIADEIITYAKSLIGTPYLYGGTTSAGFDCSGFVYHVFGQFGYSLQRVAADQYNNDGEYVDKDDLKPGDLVFFNYGGSVGHVGIYIGDGEFIHSSSGAEYSVMISRLDNKVYTQRYVGAKRVL